MSKKVALCRVSDAEPLLSLVRMLEYAGYECVLPDRGLRDYLRSVGCTNVDEPNDMCERWGAEPLVNKSMLGFSYQDLIAGLDLYIDVNAFHNGPLLWKQNRMEWLQKKTLCYFINGGPPRNTPDKGDGITPACPVMTTNRWYATEIYQEPEKVHQQWIGMGDAPWITKSYVFYPSFERWDRVLPRNPDPGGSPVCFCHNVMGWGYGQYVEEVRKLGVKFYGGGNSPDGLVRHEDVFKILSTAPCVVYLKGGGAVDYALLEAMAAGVPVMVPEKYLRDTLLTDAFPNCVRLGELDPVHDISFHLKGTVEKLKYVSARGPQIVRDLGWQEDRDGPGFKAWLERMGF